MYRKRKILQGRRGDTRHGSSRYERVENIQRKEKICRISASETRANRPACRNEYGGYLYDHAGYRKSGKEYSGGAGYAGNDKNDKRAVRGKRRIFSMAAWTASFIMVLNMLPADSPVSQVISKYEESLPALSLGIEELKNGPNGTNDIKDTADDKDVTVSSGNVSDGRDKEAAGQEDNKIDGIDNIALVISTDDTATDKNTENKITESGIKLVLSDGNGAGTGNSSGAAGAAASQNSNGSAAPQTTGQSTGGAASPQPQNGSSPGQTAVLTKSAADSSKTVKVSSATGSGEIIIYHTHATEAYAPVANAETTHSADTAGTVREAANNLTAALKAKGYSVIHDTTLHDSPSYNKSYNRSLETLKKLLKEHRSPKLVADFHRDAATASGKAKTAVVNGETVASFALVVGTKNNNYKEIRALADKIVKKSNELYPGLCTGVIEKPYKFNGYLSNNYILLELGNNANTITQVNAAVPYIADTLTNVLQ